MKKLTAVFVLLTLSLASYGQAGKLESIYVNKDVSTHFVSPEPITYVDISTDDIAGDIPVDNILRVKPKKQAPAPSIVTIVGERFMVQYQLIYTPSVKLAQSEVRLDPTQRDEYLNPDVSMSTQEMQHFALQAIARKPEVTNVSFRNQKTEISLNNIYTMGDYFFVDVSIRNKSNIAYYIDQIRFKIEDKKMVKATNFQQLEVAPVFTLYDTDSFQQKYRNVFVFRKFTFPDEKVFHMEVAEEQVSSRTLTLKIKYADVLRADTL